MSFRPKFDEFGNLSPRIHTVEIDGSHNRAASMPLIMDVIEKGSDDADEMYIDISKGMFSAKTERKQLKPPDASKKFESPKMKTPCSTRNTRSQKPAITTKWKKSHTPLGMLALNVPKKEKKLPIPKLSEQDLKKYAVSPSLPA